MNTLNKIKIKKGYGLFGKKEQSLQKLYGTAEQKIVKEIIRQNKNGRKDFTNIQNSFEIQKILNKLISYSSKISEEMVKEQFIIGRKKARINSKKVPESYNNSLEVLSDSLQGKVLTSINVIKNNLRIAWNDALSKNKNDIDKASEYFINTLKNKGTTAFVDKLGRKWNIKSYFDMVSKTTSLQATNLGTLSEDWDLYLMSSHPTACPICKPLQGRVYSKSGKNKKYPPLASIFGKIDKYGPDTLENTYLCIHPNCMHKLTKFKESGLTPKQVKEIQEKSSFTKSPPKIPEKSKKEISEYQKKTKSEIEMKKRYDQFVKLQQKKLRENIKFNVEYG